MEINGQHHGFLLFVLLANHQKLSIREHPTAKFCAKLFVSSENSWNVFAAVMFACEFIAAEKSTINASGVIAGVRDGKGYFALDQS